MADGGADDDLADIHVGRVIDGKGDRRHAERVRLCLRVVLLFVGALLVARSCRKGPPAS